MNRHPGDPRSIPHPDACPCTSRRDFLKRAGGGFGLMGLAGLLAQEGLLAAPNSIYTDPLAVRPPHYTPKAKSVISLFCLAKVKSDR